MPLIDTDRSFFEFLQEIKTAEKQKEKGKKNGSVIRLCNALLENEKLNGKTIEDILSTERDKIVGLHRMGQTSYKKLCSMLSNVPNKQSWKLFKDSGPAIRKKSVPPKVSVTLKEVLVDTNPKTTVFHITVDGGKYGTWPETANTTREVHSFFKGLEAMAAIFGMTLLRLPGIPKE
jgi:hypothetical protein